MGESGWLAQSVEYETLKNLWEKKTKYLGKMRLSVLGTDILQLGHNETQGNEN